MSYADRMRESACGCRYDSVTGLVTRFCEDHEPRPPRPPRRPR